MLGEPATPWPLTSFQTLDDPPILPTPAEESRIVVATPSRGNDLSCSETLVGAGGSDSFKDVGKRYLVC